MAQSSSQFTAKLSSFSEMKAYKPFRIGLAMLIILFGILALVGTWYMTKSVLPADAITDPTQMLKSKTVDAQVQTVWVPKSSLPLAVYDPAKPADFNPYFISADEAGYNSARATWVFIKPADTTNFIKLNIVNRAIVDNVASYHYIPADKPLNDGILAMGFIGLIVGVSILGTSKQPYSFVTVAVGIVMLIILIALTVVAFSLPFTDLTVKGTKDLTSAQTSGDFRAGFWALKV